MSFEDYSDSFTIIGDRVVPSGEYADMCWLEIQQNYRSNPVGELKKWLGRLIRQKECTLGKSGPVSVFRLRVSQITLEDEILALLQDGASRTPAVIAQELDGRFSEDDIRDALDSLWMGSELIRRRWTGRSWGWEKDRNNWERGGKHA